MPVGPYPDMEACMKDNADVEDPGAYCASIEQNMNIGWVVADVKFDNDEQGREAERLVREGKMPGISADIADVTASFEAVSYTHLTLPTTPYV